MEAKHAEDVEQATRQAEQGPAERIASAEAALKEAQTENAQLLDVFNEVEAKLAEMESLKVELEGVKKDLAEKEIVISASFSQHHHMQQQIDNTKATAAEEVKELRDANEALQAKVAALEAEKVQLVKDAEETQRQAVVAGMEKVKKQAQEQFAQAKKRYQNVLGECNAAKEAVKTKDAEVLTLKEEIQVLAKARDDAERASAQALQLKEETVAADAKKLSEAEESIASLRTEIEQGGALQRLLSQQLEEAKGEHEKHRSVMQSFWKEADQLRKQVENLTKERDALVDEKAELQKICEETIALMEQQQSA
eukprot:scaffold952_cov249-Pinguiococcus_pyrenoidosus.AAC.3